MRFETKDGHIISEQTVICGYSKQIGVYGVAAVANALAAEGAEHIGISVQIQIPDYGYQSRIHGLEKSIRKICKETAAKYSCKYLDIQEMFDAYFKIRHQCCIAWDRIHPNRIGSYMIAREFLKAMEFEF